MKTNRKQPYIFFVLNILYYAVDPIEAWTSTWIMICWRLDHSLTMTEWGNDIDSKKNIGILWVHVPRGFYHLTEALPGQWLWTKSVISGSILYTLGTGPSIMHIGDFWHCRGGQAKWVLSPQMDTFRCSEWSFLNIYITDILLLSPHVATTCSPLHWLGPVPSILYIYIQYIYRFSYIYTQGTGPSPMYFGYFSHWAGPVSGIYNRNLNTTQSTGPSPMYFSYFSHWQG